MAAGLEPVGPIAGATMVVDGAPSGREPRSGSTVFFVRRREAGAAGRPPAQPVVLVDAAVAHRHVDVEEIELVAPPHTDDAACAIRAIPVFIIDSREATLYPEAREVVIRRDWRTRQHSAGPWTGG